MSGTLSGTIRPGNPYAGWSVAINALSDRDGTNPGRMYADVTAPDNAGTATFHTFADQPGHALLMQAYNDNGATRGDVVEYVLGDAYAEVANARTPGVGITVDGTHTPGDAQAVYALLEAIAAVSRDDWDPRDAAPFVALNPEACNWA